MPTEHKRGYCQDCNEMRPISRPGTNHILHLLLSVVTAGLWIIVWILAAIKVGGWRCDSCGSKKISKVS